jgi:hypothetical protein
MWLWSLDAPGRIVAVAAMGTVHHAEPQLDSLMLFGFLSAFLTLVFYLNRHQSKAIMAALAVCLAGTALYGFLQGAWPLGLLQATWSAIALRRSFTPRSNRTVSRQTLCEVTEAMSSPLESESRISRMFGPM